MPRDTTTRNRTPYAVVTGSGSGVGRALSQQLAAAGWAVGVADIDLPAAESTLAALPAVGDAHQAIKLDVSDPSAWDAQLQALQNRWPRIDLLVNNAGVLAGGELASMPTAELRRLVEVNLLGTLYGCRAVAPWLIASAPYEVGGGGLSPRPGIINTASIFGALAPPGFAAYSATKAAVVALSESLHGELAPHGLNVTVTLPGVIKTPLFERAYFTSENIRQVAQHHAQQAQLTPEAVARQTLQAAARGELLAVIGRRARWYARLKRWWPTLTNRRVAEKSHNELR